MLHSFPLFSVLLLFSRSVVSDSLQPYDLQHTSYQSFTISQSLLRFLSIESVMPSNQLILCCPLFLLPSIFPSIRVFSSESPLYIRWPHYWNFSISPSNEFSGLISFRIDCFDLLAVQGTLKSLLQHQNLKASYQFFSFSSIKKISTHNCWKNHGFDCMDLCQQSDVSAV